MDASSTSASTNGHTNTFASVNKPHSHSHSHPSSQPANAPSAPGVESSPTKTQPTPTSITTKAIIPPAAPPQLSVPAKRKRSPKAPMQKFYAVRVGKAPGIYHTWPECLDQVRGFPKAAFKSFLSLSEAQAFVSDERFGGGSGAREGAASGEGGAGGGHTKFYGVQEGRVPGVYTSWGDVLENITGWKAPRHRSFKSRSEAERFVAQGRDGSANSDHETEAPDPKPKKSKTTITIRKPQNPDLASQHTNDNSPSYPPGEAPLPPGSSDGFDSTILLSPSAPSNLRYKSGGEHTKLKYQPSRPAALAPVRIYTDGSTLSNGQLNSIGGVGVYFGPKDGRNISEPLAGGKQTNQRAELTALLRALEVGPKDRRLVVCSDSKYAISCVTEWCFKWRSNGWTNSAGKAVENKDLVGKIVDLLDERRSVNKHREIDQDESGDAAEKGPWEGGVAGVRFQWVKGHAADEGNSAADELAVSGARTARELGEEVVLD